MTAVAAVDGELWHRYRETGDVEARHALLDQYLGLVYHAARRMAVHTGGQVELDDLVSAGTVGLVMALESFDPGRGLAFSTHAVPRIRGAILDDLRARDWVSRGVRTKRRKIQAAEAQLESVLGRRAAGREVAACLGVAPETYWGWRQSSESVHRSSLEAPVASQDGESHRHEEVIADPTCAAPLDDIVQREDIRAVVDALETLPEKERIVLSLSYLEEMTLRQIGEVLHLTECRISQIRKQALARLRTTLAASAVL